MVENIVLEKKTKIFRSKSRQKLFFGKFSTIFEKSQKLYKEFLEKPYRILGIFQNFRKFSRKIIFDHFSIEKFSKKMFEEKISTTYVDVEFRADSKNHT